MKLLTFTCIVVLASFSLTPAFATDCKKLAPLVCLESVRCTLDCKRLVGDPHRCVGKDSYFCRSEDGECEMATNQSTLTKRDCESNPKCAYTPGYCFCRCDFDPSCDCGCGGGPPPNCVLRSADLFPRKAEASEAVANFGIVANGCFEIENRQLKVGELVTVISLDGQRRTKSSKSKIAGLSCPRNHVSYNNSAEFVGMAYQLEQADSEGVGAIGAVNSSDLSLTECASTEGLHRNIWTQRNGERTKVWHGYRYLGYDVEPDCKDVDVVDAAQSR